MDPAFVAPAENNPALVIRQLAGTSITTFSTPFARGGFLPIGGRSTAVKLNDGSVFLVASHPLCAVTLSTLRALGPVESLVAIDLEHNIFIPQYASAYPQAKIYAPDSLVKKWDKSDGPMKGKTHFVYARGEGCDLAQRTNGEIKVVDFGKSFVNEDIAFLHVPSKTLIEADLLFNLPAKEQYSQSKERASIPFSGHLCAGSTIQKRLLWHLLGKDRAGMTKNARLVSAWDFDRIIPCHGDVIETGGKAAWDSTYAYYLNGKI